MSGQHFNIFDTYINKSISSQLSAFNWQEKKILRIDAKEKKKQLKLNFSGPFVDLSDIIPEDGKLIDIEENSTYSFESEWKISNQDDKKVVAIEKLFGSSKPRHFLPRKVRSKSFFSHKKIFGQCAEAIDNN